MSKFEKTFCSQCGEGFGPGDAGFSHCADHSPILPRLPLPVIPNLHAAPELVWVNGGYTADQMRTYGRACVAAASRSHT